MVFHRHLNNMHRKRRFVPPEEEEGDVKKKFVENVVGEILQDLHRPARIRFKGDPTSSKV